MEPKYIDVFYGTKKYEFSGFVCPKCDSKWLTQDEINTGLKRVAADNGSSPVKSAKKSKQESNEINID